MVSVRHVRALSSQNVNIFTAQVLFWAVFIPKCYIVNTIKLGIKTLWRCSMPEYDYSEIRELLDRPIAQQALCHDRF